ncbi:hypothetical protein [Tengunoibacter tsumagoiensis]|uniref:Uncharacterized protein n=1 Tax=Tengunoibacter tsumagoiensis TaxID=2014871 RepID=A0A401ZVY1_9CHLR|nr:hypothetical protein [Tengunoibacter tsumagoiensis]GCE11061.1 hypothetical protein KTT_09200 [Tengunoibacter tsumagoiensis]
MSNQYTQDSDSGAINNGSSVAHRREARANHMTGALPPLSSFAVERSYPGAFDFDEMILSLRAQFEQDRQIASQPNTTRCGICYLHFTVGELHYQDEGFYTCPACEQSLGQQRLNMLRKQQKL